MKTIKELSATLIITSIMGCSTAATSTPTGRIIEFKSDANGFDTKSYFYEGANEVVAFDAQFTPELARASIAHLRKVTSKPITWLVITHPNPDKFNGASVFKELGAKVVASEATSLTIPDVHSYKRYYFVEMAKMFKPEEYPQPVSVDRTFRDELKLELSDGDSIRLVELKNAGVSSTQTVAYVPRINALLVGDLVHHKAHAWLEGGIVNGQPKPNIASWIRALTELTSSFDDGTLVYGGRGQPGYLGAVASEQARYLKSAQSIVRSELKKLGARAKDEFSGERAAAAYKTLARRFAEKFPDYELPYMIEYGAYGLVNSELAAK